MGLGKSMDIRLCLNLLHVCKPLLSGNAEGQETCMPSSTRKVIINLFRTTRVQVVLEVSRYIQFTLAGLESF